jgi:hypothetical protein
MPETNDRVRAEIAARAAEAILTEVAGRWVLTMTRALRHPSERVWPYLTEPGQLGRWSPVVPDRALTSVGPATSRETPEQNPVDAEVLVSLALRFSVTQAAKSCWTSSTETPCWNCVWSQPSRWRWCTACSARSASPSVASAWPAAPSRARPSSRYR